VIFARRIRCPLRGVERTLCEVIATFESDPTETLLGGLSSTTMVSGKEREHANQTLKTFRPVGVSYLGDRGRSAGVLERNLDRSLETLLLFDGRPYVRRHYCLPRGALGCVRGHRDLSPDWLRCWSRRSSPGNSRSPGHRPGRARGRRWMWTLALATSA
jgi:hypothetical protein